MALPAGRRHAALESLAQRPGSQAWTLSRPATGRLAMGLFCAPLPPDPLPGEGARPPIKPRRLLPGSQLARSAIGEVESLPGLGRTRRMAAPLAGTFSAGFRRGAAQGRPGLGPCVRPAPTLPGSPRARDGPRRQGRAGHRARVGGTRPQGRAGGKAGPDRRLAVRAAVGRVGRVARAAGRTTRGDPGGVAGR